jgi:hypothetical protein
LSMTTDRRKAILFLSLTLVIGIVIGSLIPAVYGRFYHRHDRGDGKEWNDKRDGKRGGGDRKQWLMHTIVRVVKPDSDQVKAIRPLTEQATDRIRGLEKNSNERMESIFDSLHLQLKPILTEEQNKKLEEFSTKARARWKERR